MAAFKLPRLKANLAIVNGQGKPLDYFLRFWNIEVAPRIEQQEASQDQILQQLEEQQEAIQDVQDQQAEQLALINQALELAGIALEQAGGSAGSSSMVVDVDDVIWVNGPVVGLPTSTPGTILITGSGMQVTPATTQLTNPSSGLLRLVRIDGGETVIGGPWTWEAELGGKPPPKTFIANDSAIGSFSYADAGGVGVQYRLDANADLGSGVEDVNLYLFVRKT